MKTRTMKILVAILSALITVCMCGSVAFAARDTAITPGSLSPTYDGTSDIQDMGENIMGIISTVGVVISVVVLMILGIKYMMGSAEEKADYKKTMIPYIVGAILLFGASSVATMVYNFANGLN